MNIYLFRKYWGKHKGRLFSLLLSIILLTATVVFSILNERSEMRKSLHESYDSGGNYSFVLHNVDDECERKINDLDRPNMFGKISAIGTLRVIDDTYTVGFFEDETAVQAYHLPIIRGNLPEKGQIVFPQFLLRQLYGDKDIGEKISFEVNDLNGQKHEMTFELSGIFSDGLWRDDMEYGGAQKGSTIIHNSEKFPDPSLYINISDAEKFEKYTNYIYFADEKSVANGNDDASEILAELKTHCTRFSSGMLSLNLMSITNNFGNSGDGLNIRPSENTRIIRYITFCMMLVSAMAMFTGVMSIMPKRIESLQLLRSIGMSKRRLLKLFITELFLIWVIGNAVGIGLGCGVHEVVHASRKMMGIPSFRGYSVEYIVGEVTQNPFILPVIMSLIIAGISLVIPVTKILKMTFYEKASVKKSRKKVKNVRSAFSKMTGSKILTTLSFFSIIIVIFVSMFGYCYYTNFGKGKTELGMGNDFSSENFYKVNDVDMKKEMLDFSVKSDIPMGNAIAVYDKDYGISIENVSEFSENGTVYSWESYPAYTVIFEENDVKPNSINSFAVPFNDEWEHYEKFKEKIICDTQLVIVNDNVMKRFGNYSSDDVIAVSDHVPPYKSGDVVPMFSCLCDENKSALLETSKRIEVTITNDVVVQDKNSEKDDIIGRGIYSGFTDNAIVMTAEKSRKLGFYHVAYTNCFVDLEAEMTDKEIRLMVNEIMGKPVIVKTFEELKRNAMVNILSANVNVIVLFILLFVLCLVSIVNNIRMNVENNIEKFSTLHVLGMSRKRIKNMFVYNIMSNTIIACISGIIASYSGQFLMKKCFGKYLKLEEIRREIAAHLMSESQLKEGGDYYILEHQIHDIRENFIFL